MKILLFLVGAIFSSCVFSQNINYSIIEDAPQNNPNSFVNLEYFGMDGGKNSNSGLFLGTNANYQVTSKLAVEGNLRVKYLNFSKVDKKPLFNFDAGSNYLLLSKSKKKDIKIVTSHSTKTDHFEGKQTTTSEFFKAQGTVERNLFGRAGVSFRRNSSDIFSSGFSSIEGTFSSLAVYAGINFQTNTRINTKVTEGESEYTAGAGLLVNFYGDFLFSPIINTPLQLTSDPSRIGFRLGVQWYQTYATNFFRKMMIFTEISRRPIESTVLTIGVGYSLYRD